MGTLSDLWPYHPKPSPDELLSSWLVRIAHGHGMKLQTFCRVSLGKGQEVWNRDIDREAPDWLMRRLGAHTGMGIRRVRRMGLSTYNGLLYRRTLLSGQQYWLLPLKMFNVRRLHYGMQYCPFCLAEDKVPYFRRRWRVALYTMCAKHRCMLLDRCPSCGAPVAFHRGEMGKVSQVEAGPISLCHACGFDLRAANTTVPEIYDQSAFETWLPILKMLEGVTRGVVYDVGYFAVAHQLCKIMLTHYSYVHLREFVSRKIGAPGITLHEGHDPFEEYALQERHVVIQLAMWILADPEARIVDMWRSKAVRYNILKKDFCDAPRWYRAIVDRCSDWRRL